MFNFVVLICAVLCFVVLYCVVLCCVFLLCFVMLCSIVQFTIPLGQMYKNREIVVEVSLFEKERPISSQWYWAVLAAL